MVPVPVPLPLIVAFAGDESATVNCLGRLNVAVPLAVTVTVLLVCPGSNVSVPLAAVKSPGDMAVAFAVCKWPVTLARLAAKGWRLKVGGVVPLVPTVADASPMLSVVVEVVSVRVRARAE